MKRTHLATEATMLALLTDFERIRARQEDGAQRANAAVSLCGTQELGSGRR
jgi:hypothetical protein